MRADGPRWFFLTVGRPTCPPFSVSPLRVLPQMSRRTPRQGSSGAGARPKDVTAPRGNQDARMDINSPNGSVLREDERPGCAYRVDGLRRPTSTSSQRATLMRRLLPTLCESLGAVGASGNVGRECTSSHRDEKGHRSADIGRSDLGGRESTRGPFRLRAAGPACVRWVAAGWLCSTSRHRLGAVREVAG